MLKLPTGKIVAIDTETTGLRWEHGDEAFAVGFCDEHGRTAYVDWPVDPWTRRVLYRRSDLQLIRRWAKQRRRYAFFNAPFDLRMLRIMGIEFDMDMIDDTQIGMHTCDTRLQWDQLSLKKLAKRFANVPDDDQSDLQKATVSARLKAKKLDWKIAEDVEADYWLVKALAPEDEKCKTYCLQDCERTILLKLFMDEMLPQLGRQETYDFEMRKVFPVIHRFMDRGLHCSEEVCDAEIHNCYAKRDAIGKELNRMAGNWQPDFNSHTQVKRFLFFGEPFRYEAKIHTKTGPSSAQDSLEAIAHEPAVSKLIEWRSWDKGPSSFFLPYRRAIARDSNDHPVIYPRIKQAGKLTRRLSCSDPNLQGSADDQGGRGASEVPARKPFGPRPGCVWVLIDYNQLEVRTFAAASKYDRLIEILNSGEDLHTEATNGIWGGQGNPRAIRAACEALGTQDEYKAGSWLESFNWDIVKAEASLNLKTSRNKGKPFFFTRMFGGGKNSISFKLNCSLGEAASLVRAYDQRLPGVIGFVRRAQREAERRGGHVYTVYGRPLDMPIGETHKASPYIVQGTAADLVKEAMIDCDTYLNSLGYTDHGIILQIHDELIFELPESVLTTDRHVVTILIKIMESQADVINDQPDMPGWIATPVKAKYVPHGGNWSRPLDWETNDG